MMVSRLEGQREAVGTAEYQRLKWTCTGNEPLEEEQQEEKR